MRLEPSTLQTRWATPGMSRNVAPNAAARVGQSTSLRSCSSPRSGSGEAESQSSSSGSSCCMIRELPREAVRELAQRRAGVLRVGEAERGEPSSAASARQRARARERTRGAARRTVARGSTAPRSGARRCTSSNASSAVACGVSRKPRTRARRTRDRFVGRDGVRLPLVPSWTGARRAAGTCRPRRVVRRRRDRRSRRRRVDERVERVGAERDSSSRPWTSCRSCTANSTSRIPPRPRFTSRSVSPSWRASSSARAFSARTSRTASGSRRSAQTYGRRRRPSSGRRGRHRPRRAAP